MAAPRYISGQYPTTGLTAHHLREFVRLLDASAVPDEALAFIFPTSNRGVPMVTLRVDLDDDDDLSVYDGKDTARPA